MTDIVNSIDEFSPLYTNDLLEKYPDLRHYLPLCRNVCLDWISFLETEISIYSPIQVGDGDSSFEFHRRFFILLCSTLGIEKYDITVEEFVKAFPSSHQYYLEEIRSIALNFAKYENLESFFKEYPETNLPIPIEGYEEVIEKIFKEFHTEPGN